MDTKTAQDFYHELVANTDALLTNKVDYEGFHETQKVIWKAIRAAGRPTERQVAALLLRDATLSG